ncbi:amidohydrolase family protein [Sinobaca sp. H24]|uniref:amidohydrolase family protein n=1 Tax=Sinobaca sp. H24 TaxID=2923376 RepID=UPI002079FBE2|nr:amidohydrolase family protein [Sinobaca sp. H24]
MRYTIKNVHIVRGNQNNAVSYNQWLRVEDEKIAAIGSGEPEVQAGEELIDGKGRWLTPGMYNTHGHTPMALLRGVSDDVVLQEWLGNNIWPREALFDKEVSEAGTMLAQAEMIRSGTVAFQDMYHIDMDAVFQTAQDSGLKAVLARAMIGLVDQPEQKRRLDEAIYLGEKWDTEGGSRIKGMMFPHAPYTCPPGFMKEIVKAAHEKMDARCSFNGNAP